MTTERAGVRFGVRVRILATVLLLAALGMAIAGSAFTVFQRRQLMNHLDGVLLADVRQFTVYATQVRTDGGPPQLKEVLREALRRHAPADGESMGAFVDGELVWVTTDPNLDIRSERGLRAEVKTLPPDAPTRIRQLESPTSGPLRYAAVQTRVPGRPEVGTFVVAVRLQPSLDQLAQSAQLYAALSVAALILVGIGGWLVAGRLLRPLRLLQTAAQSISHTDLAARIPVRGSDDVSQLTRTVNAMLDRLEAAFDTQQQFLDDAGHELRTPITIVRGHLELLDAADPADVAATRALVMDELDRMARLVSDLIALAQAGRPDFVRFEPVDLDTWLREVLDKAQAMADRHWVLDATAGVVVQADAHRLTQAMLQLIDNAVKHTGEDDEIAIGGILSRGAVQLWVRDTGPGVAPEDEARIFERFGRAAPSRGDAGSSGLGLAIVASIAAAHGGTVALDRPAAAPSARPGARFTLTLPLVVRARTRPIAGGPPRAPRPADGRFADTIPLEAHR